MDAEAEPITFTTKQLAQEALDANLAIQRALSERAAQLEAQLKQLDDLVETVHKGVPAEEIPEDELGNEIQIPGTKKVSSPLVPSELLSPSSPFFEEASQRAHYVRWTTIHPIKGKEAEVLADAVRKENQRLEAYRCRNSPSAPVIDVTNNIDGIDWSIVAEKVSDASSVKRTPDECRIQWVGNLHPRVNHGEWTKAELDKLNVLASAVLDAGEQINWVKVAGELGTNRIPVECMKRATMASRPKHFWDVEADQRLLAAIEKFGVNNWRPVARAMSEYVTTMQCQNRYFRSIDPSIKHAHWTPNEEARLRRAVAAYGHSWVDVASVIPGRTNDQCREKWNDLGKGEKARRWTKEEDAALVNAVEELGNRWKEIAKRVGGRTGPNCRLRYDRLKDRMKTQVEGEAGTSTADANGCPSEAAIANETSTAVLESMPQQKSTASKPKARLSKRVQKRAESNKEAGGSTQTRAEKEAQIMGEHVLPKKPRQTSREDKGRGKKMNLIQGLSILEGTETNKTRSEVTEPEHGHGIGQVDITTGTQEEISNGGALPEGFTKRKQTVESGMKERGKGKGKRKRRGNDEGSVAVEEGVETHRKKKRQRRGNQDDDGIVIGGVNPAQGSAESEVNASCQGRASILEEGNEEGSSLNNRHGEIQETDADLVGLSASTDIQGNERVIGDKPTSAKGRRQGRGKGTKVLSEGSRRSERIASRIENT